MTSRIMHLAGGRPRPLSFDGSGSACPSLLGSATPWKGLPIEGHRLRSQEGRGEWGPVDGESGLLAITEGQMEFVSRRGDRETRQVARAGSTFLLSGADRPTFVRMTGAADAVAIHFPPEWLERLSLGPAGFRHSRRLPDDPTMASLVRAMRDEVARGAPSGRLFADSLSLALLSYVTQQANPTPVPSRGRLSDAECVRVAAYVRERLADDIGLDDLAAQIGRRPRHFSTLFQLAFGVSPYRYILNQRLAEGARRLTTGDQPIAAIAFGLGFSSQSHFAAAFRRAFGVSPRRYAADNRPPFAGS